MGEEALKYSFLLCMIPIYNALLYSKPKHHARRWGMVHLLVRVDVQVVNVHHALHPQYVPLVLLRGGHTYRPPAKTSAAE